MANIAFLHQIYVITSTCLNLYFGSLIWLTYPNMSTSYSPSSLTVWIDEDATAEESSMEIIELIESEMQQEIKAVLETNYFFSLQYKNKNKNGLSGISVQAWIIKALCGKISTLYIILKLKFKWALSHDNMVLKSLFRQLYGSFMKGIKSMIVIMNVWFSFLDSFIRFGETTQILHFASPYTPCDISIAYHHFLSLEQT